MKDLTKSEIINKNFFFIDSNNLSNVNSRFYGYCFDGDNIYISRDESTVSTVISKIRGGGICTGAFVVIQRNQNNIEIIPDYIGSHGLFLFRHESYFAISNSFILLVDNIKTKYPLTLNEDYAYFALTKDSLSLEETLINEVRLIPRNYKVVIDIDKCSLTEERIYYQEYSIPVESAEGVQIIDDWFQRWVNIIRKLSNENRHLMLDVTGGKDSRLNLALFLNSGINMNEIYMRALIDHFKDHIEDYKISSEIAKCFNLELNNIPSSYKVEMLPIEEIINASFYAKLGFHNQMYFGSTGYNIKPLYHFSGGAAEVMRGYWRQYTIEQLISEMVTSVDHRFKSVNINKSIEKVLRNSFDRIEKMFDISEGTYPPASTRLYKETRTRQHYGRGWVEQYLSNNITLAPTTDCNIHKLKIPFINGDTHLMFAFILERYCKKLLEFKIEGGRIFPNETLRCAKLLNEKFPLNNEFANQKIKIQTSAVNEPKIEVKDVRKDIEDYLIKITRNENFKNIFTSHFPLEIYTVAQRYADKVKFHPLSRLYPIIAVTKALMDCEVSQQANASTALEGIYNMANDDDYRLKNNSEILNRLFKIISTARIKLDIDNLDDINITRFDGNDVVDKGKVFNRGYTFEIIMPDDKYLLESDKQHLHLKLSCKKSIELKMLFQGLKLKGLDLPIFIDYTDISINGKNLLNDKRISVSYDEPYKVTLNLQEGIEYEMKISWTIHGYNIDDFVNITEKILKG